MTHYRDAREVRACTDVAYRAARAARAAEPYGYYGPAQEAQRKASIVDYAAYLALAVARGLSRR